LSGQTRVQTLQMSGGYGSRWDCRWQINCRGPMFLRFTEFGLEQDFDRLELYSGRTVASLQLRLCDSACQASRGCARLRDSAARCLAWKRRGECTQNSAYMLVNCAYSCSICAPPDRPTLPTDSWSGSDVPDTVVASGAVTLRLVTDDFVGGEGFSIECVNAQYELQ
jgi:hypothetical protein